MIQATLLQKGNQKMALRNVLVVENDNERLRKQSREITEITDKIKVYSIFNFNKLKSNKY